MKKELYYVTSNPGKFAEVAEYLNAQVPDIELKQCDADIPEIQTLDQMAIAVDKAKKAYQILQKPLIVDDAAIYFEKYYKFPGTLTKFVSQGIGFEGLKRLIDQGDRATFLLYIVYMESPEQYHVFEGTCSGVLVKPETFQGNQHLPFDVFFKPDGADLTYQDMRLSFNDYSDFYYRIRAMKKFLSWYKER
jgi:XTP/dITP diphosphohydrolase